MEIKKIADFTTSAQSAARRVRGYLAGLVGLASSAAPSGAGIAPRMTAAGSHHLGNVGHGHTSRKRASQRQRSNRRHAKRAAKAGR